MDPLFGTVIIVVVVCARECLILHSCQDSLTLVSVKFLSMMPYFEQVSLLLVAICVYM